jgi:hypothetical protein
VIDDLHWSDRATIMMLAYVARSNPRSMLVIGAYREGELGPSHPLIGTLAELRRDAAIERVVLGGLVPEQVRTLTEAWLGPLVAPSLVDALCEASGGNPFFLEELLRHLEERDVDTGGARAVSVSGLGLPEGVKDVVRARLARLGPAAPMLRVAAVAGREFDLELLAAAIDGSREQLIESLDAALDAQLIREADGRGRYAFNHALVREAIFTELSSARRSLLHDRIGSALERLADEPRDAPLPELAHHFLLAEEASLAKAIRYARAAARQAGSQLAYESASALYERALEAAARWRRDAGSERVELLLELGAVLLRSGETAASRERFSEAAALARAHGDAALLARAALGRSGLSVTVLGVDPENVALLEEALSGVRDDALRARLLGRLAIEVYYEPPAARREELSSTAVELARAASSPEALIDALSARHVALWSAAHLDARVALADEMIALGGDAGDLERELQGHNWRFMDLLESGDVPAAREELARHGALADRLRLPGYQWWDPMWSATLALLEGRLDDAVELRRRAREIGRRAGDKVAELFAWIQDFYVQWERGSAEPDGPPETVAVAPVTSALRSDVPLMLTEAGRIDEARSEFERLAHDEFSAVPNDLNWLASMAGLAQAASELDDAVWARELYRMLAPYRARAILVGRAAVCLGPAELYLGMLAGTFGEAELAASHFDAATTWSHASGAALWRVWADVHRARARLRVGASAEDAATPAEVAADALTAAERAGLGRAATHARAVLRAAQATA